MDRTGIIAIILCVLAYLVLQAEFARLYPSHPVPAKVAAGNVGASNRAPVTAAPSTPLPITPAPASPAMPGTPALTEAPPATAGPEKLNVLENAFIKATFSTHGASLKEVDLKKYRDGASVDVVLNSKSHDNVLSVVGWPGADAAAFEVQRLPGGLTYTAALPSGLSWTRTYTLGTDYTISVKDTLGNAGTGPVVMPAYSLSLGRAHPQHALGRDYQAASNQYVGAGWLTTKSFHLTTVNNFNSGGWFFAPKPGSDLFTSASVDANPLRWLAVQDQFFAVLLTPDGHHPMSGATFQCFNTRDSGGNIPHTDEPNIEAFADFPGMTIPAGQALALNYTVYTGPKEYGRLNALGENQGELMNYNGFLPFALLIVPMLWVMHSFNSFFNSYGIAIILLTLVIKVVTWPLQSYANRSAKRMQAVAPKIKELQAKYKEQPDKLNTETFALYRDYSVNPVAGCVPALIQMPVFFSLYYMLQNAVELRGQHFIWVHDLTQPDTIFSHALPFSLFGISHIVLNPLPIMVTALMAVMMRMTPQIGDPQQQKVAQFMPLFFLFLFYNFAAALSLYYVINNAVSIFQIYRNLRKPLPELKRKPKKE